MAILVERLSPLQYAAHRCLKTRCKMRFAASILGEYEGTYPLISEIDVSRPGMDTPLAAIAGQLGAALGRRIDLRLAAEVGGGCIHSACRATGRQTKLVCQI